MGKYDYHIYRHAFSCANVKKSVGGIANRINKFMETDPQLSSFGVESALLFTPKKSGLEYVFVSCLMRTWQTAILLFGKSNVSKLTLIVSPFLKETGMGAENKPYEFYEQCVYMLNFLTIIRDFPMMSRLRHVTIIYKKNHVTFDMNNLHRMSFLKSVRTRNQTLAKDSNPTRLSNPDPVVFRTRSSPRKSVSIHESKNQIKTIESNPDPISIATDSESSATDTESSATDSKSIENIQTTDDFFVGSDGNPSEPVIKSPSDPVIKSPSEPAKEDPMPSLWQGGADQKYTPEYSEQSDIKKFIEWIENGTVIKDISFPTTMEIPSPVMVVSHNSLMSSYIKTFDKSFNVSLLKDENLWSIIFNNGELSIQPGIAKPKIFIEPECELLCEPVGNIDKYITCMKKKKRDTINLKNLEFDILLKQDGSFFDENPEKQGGRRHYKKTRKSRKNFRKKRTQKHRWG